MFHNTPLSKHRARSQSGLGVIAAIVILVILATLAAFIAHLSTMQAVGSALDVQSARAYSAAQSGVEWGAYETIKGSAATRAALCSTGGTTSNLDAIDGMTVTVTCTEAASGSTKEANLGTIYVITSTACNMPAAGVCPGDTTNSNYVERRIVAISEN